MIALSSMETSELTPPKEEAILSIAASDPRPERVRSPRTERIAPATVQREKALTVNSLTTDPV